jgi:uncharacterized membrane protein
MTAEPRRNRGRLILIGVLALSLLGNAVALGGALRLAALRGELLGPAADSALFPRATRVALREALRAHEADLLPPLHDLTRQRATLVATASARPFDRAAVEAEMAQTRRMADALLAQTQIILLDALEAQAKAGN